MRRPWTYADRPVERTVDVWDDVLYSARQIGMLTVQDVRTAQKALPEEVVEIDLSA